MDVVCRLLPRGLAAAAFVLMFISGAAAAPWIEPGDQRMRHSLQVLSDQGRMDTPLNTWPVMWSGVSEQLRTGSGGGSGRTGAQRSYIQFEQQRFAQRGWKTEVGVGASNQTPLFRDFGEQAREQRQAEISANWTGREWALGLNGQYANDPADDDELRADGSFIAYTGGDWTLGVGAIDRWWGPGWQSSLMLSSNARPIPSVWLNRTQPSASDHPLLSWLGPWQFTLSVGQLEDERTVSEPLLVAMRLNFRPLSGLELGLSRTFMYGGEGESRNGSALWRGLRGEEVGESHEPQRTSQKVGADFRYGLAVGDVSGGVYGEGVAQWRSDRDPGQFMGLFGADLALPWDDDSHRLFIEYANTTAGQLFSDAREGVAYEDERYRTGYRHRGRNMGSTYERDAEVVTLGWQQYLADGRNLMVTAAQARLNKAGQVAAQVPDGDVDYAVVPDGRKVFLATARYEYPIWGGWASLSGQWADKRMPIATADGSGRAQGTLAASWRYRF